MIQILRHFIESSCGVRKVKLGQQLLVVERHLIVLLTLPLKEISDLLKDTLPRILINKLLKVSVDIVVDLVLFKLLGQVM